MNDLQIPSDLQQMFEDSKLDTTMFVGSGIRTLIVRVAEAEAWASRLSAELDKGDSWAWIRSKMEKCRTQFKWYTPRTDSLIGTRYEVMGWLHVLFAHADPKVYIDITIEQQKKADDAEEELKRIKFEHANQCQTIEAYQNEVRTLEGNIATWGMVELSVRNPNVQSYMDHWEERATKAEAENNKLRGLLAKGQGDCVYCGLPAADIAKCPSGFPGCARMDDIVNKEETAVEMENTNLRVHVLNLTEALMVATEKLDGK